MSKNPFKLWYKEGLHFKCTGCGGCCTGAPGYVWLTEEDIENLSNKLKLSQTEFLRKYTRFVKGRYSLKEILPKYDCIFLKDKKCSVYEARPGQCRQFPWWIENLKDKQAWEDAALSCEGINHPDAPKVPYEEIQAALESDENLS